MVSVLVSFFFGVSLTLVNSLTNHGSITFAFTHSIITTYHLQTFMTFLE